MTSFLDGLHNAGFTTNDELTNLYTSYRAERPEVGMFKADWSLPEPTQDKYSDDLLSKATAFGDAAVVTIARSGREGFDLPRDVNKEMADNPYFSYTNNSEEYTDFEDGQGYLELTHPEKDMIQLAKKTSTKTIVVINATNVFQLGELQEDPEINANVSGVFAEEDPLNKDTQTQPSFVNYNDSIYVGYRWYETAAAEGVIDYANAVVYPFGYGLSRYNNVTVEPTPEALANSNYTELDFQDGQVSADFLDALGAIDFGMTFKE